MTMRASSGRLPVQAWSVVALLLYAAFVVYQSLVDGGAWRCSDLVLSAAGRMSRADLLANVVAYVPLGFLFVLATTDPRNARWGRTAVVGLGGVVVMGVLSLTMELVQACQAGRVSSAFDLAANTAGATAGVMAALTLRGYVALALARSAPDDRGRAVLRVVTVAVAGLWVISQTMPWVLAVDLGTFRANLSFLQHWSSSLPLDLWRVGRHAGAWVAIACAWGLVGGTPMRAVAGYVATAGASLVLQVMLDARAPLSFEELVGMGVVSVVAVAVLWRRTARTRPRRWALALATGAVCAVAAYELQPGTAGTVVRGFSWWPRVGLGGLLGAVDYALLFGWLGWSVRAAAQWARHDGWPRAGVVWPVVAVGATLALEGAQMHIPGRGPDVSAPLFTLLGALVAAAALGSSPDAGPGGPDSPTPRQARGRGRAPSDLSERPPPSTQ